MNINKLIGGNSVRTSTSATEPSDKKAAPSSKVSDKVSLSSIQELESEIKSYPEVNDALVDKVRSALSNGEYKIDYEKLAGKMLDFDGIHH